MKSVFEKTIAFIKENPSIIYSLILVIIIPAAFFINTYTITNNFESNIDTITQSHAVMAENLIKHLVDENADTEKLQMTIENIARENEMIMPVSITVMRPGEDRDSFNVIASTDKNLIGQKANDLQDTLAWKQPEGIAYLAQNEQGRFWRVSKAFTNSSGEKSNLIAMSFSLSDTDKLISSTINHSYWILVITILVVILFVSNQARLFGYALTLAKLKEIDKMKDMFISMASHELRAPLTAIKGYVEFLGEKKEVTENQEAGHFVKNISLSVDRLQNLVNDILEVSRIEGNRLPVEITTFNPHEIIPGTIEELKSSATQKGLALDYKPGVTDVMVRADNSRLKQILVNLVGNSIKYTEKGSVEVTTAIKDSEYLITIADTGIGISAEGQTRLFQKFNRIQNEKTKNIVGTGLGLWITLELIKRMRGKITVESIEGVGSHFTVHLPMEKK